MSAELVVRAPNHLGDLVMALPALGAAGGADIVVARWLVPLVELARDAGALPFGGEVLPLDRGVRRLPLAALALRRRWPRRGVLLTPSFSSALLFLAAGVRQRRGTPTDGRRPLLTDPVPVAALDGLHQSARYHLLVTGRRPDAVPVPRLAVPEPDLERFRDLAGAGDRLVAVFPGSHAPARRWPVERWREVVRRLAAGGARVLVFGSPAEREWTAAVAEGGGFDLGGRTDLRLLAAGLAACRVFVGNDSGPMHLAAAVGTPVVTLLGPADIRVTGPLGEGHRVLHRPDLPCVPCVKNHCPRKGAGYILPEAEQECLRLIGVDEVAAAAVAATIAG